MCERDRERERVRDRQREKRERRRKKERKNESNVPDAGEMKWCIAIAIPEHKKQSIFNGHVRK